MLCGAFRVGLNGKPMVSAYRDTGLKTDCAALKRSALRLRVFQGTRWCKREGGDAQ